VTPSGIKPVTFWLVEQCLNQLCHCMPHRLYRITKMPNKTQQWLYNKNKKTTNLIDTENVSPTFYRAVWRKTVTERESMTFHSQNPLMCCTQNGT
jgi:hypothetical protein